jgi:SAM-dependent methyltransferase
MPFEIKNCPLCSSIQSIHFDTREFRGYQVTNKLCSNCGLVYQSPRMTDEELATFYEHEYRRVYQGSEGPLQTDLVVQGQRAENLLKFVQGEYIENVQRHLDIGCSAGALLIEFNKAFGCQSVGIEPGQVYRDYSKKRGLMVYDSLDSLDEANDFDLISMAHVLEHLPDPVDYLSRLRKSTITPKGWLLLEVPNLYAHDCFEVAHLVSFSAHTITQVVEQAGFQINALIKHGRPRSSLIPLYITLLAQPDSDQKPKRLRPESGVSMKRQAGMLHRKMLSKLFPRKAWIS